MSDIGGPLRVVVTNEALQLLKLSPGLYEADVRTGLARAAFPDSIVEILQPLRSFSADLVHAGDCLSHVAAELHVKVVELPPTPVVLIVFEFDLTNTPIGAVLPSMVI